MVDEQLTQVDENDNVIGPINRAEAHSNPKIIHRTVSILLFNEHKQILIQKRSNNVDLFPNKYDISVGGHVKFGDSCIKTALHEAQEEIGVHLLKSQLKPICKTFEKSKYETEIVQNYIAHVNSSDLSLKPNDEVSEFSFISVSNFLDSTTNNKEIWAEWVFQTLQNLDIQNLLKSML